METNDAIKYVQSCGESDGPESYEDAAELFRAVIGRAPDADDGDAGDLWSHVCAAVPAQISSADDMIARVVALVGYEPREDGTTGQVVRQALADDPTATAEDIAAIIREARDDAKAERANGY